MENEITKERIEEHLKDFDNVAQHLCKDLQTFAMQQSLKQMQVTEKNTKLLDDVIVLETEMRATGAVAIEIGGKITDYLVNLRKVWADTHFITKEEYGKIIEESKKNVTEILKKRHNIKDEGEEE